jgi:hypothetical protein
LCLLVLGEDRLEAEEGLVTKALVLVWVLDPLAAPPLDVGSRSSDHSGRGLVPALSTSGTSGAVADVDADVDDAEVGREVAVVLDRDSGLTLGLAAGSVDGVVDVSANVEESKEQASADNKSSSSVSEPTSVVDALNVAASVPAPDPEPPVLTPAD